MAHPAKWRETCDPLSLAYHEFEPLAILGYPHARNDVFHVLGRHHGVKQEAYIKVARHPDSAIAYEAALLSQLDSPIFPRVLDSGDAPSSFSVTQALPGDRLSVILGSNENMSSMTYLKEYGAALASLHRLSPDAPPQAIRRFHQRPPDELLDRLELSHLRTFFSAPPAASATVFCHGDFHYANVLWEAGHISAILDFELAGYGNRDFDIAWALFRRPGQRFLTTPEEEQRFLDGYDEVGAYDLPAIHYYMAQCYVYFLTFRNNDQEYNDYIRHWLENNCVAPQAT